MPTADRSADESRRRTGDLVARWRELELEYQLLAASLVGAEPLSREHGLAIVQARARADVGLSAVLKAALGWTPAPGLGPQPISDDLTTRRPQSPPAKEPR